MTTSTWANIATKLERVISDAAEPFDRDTIANGRDLLALASGLCAPPNDFGKGYWSTFRFVWNDVEVEVFGDHFETYRGEEIAHFLHCPGQAFPPDFIARLPTTSR